MFSFTVSRFYLLRNLKVKASAIKVSLFQQSSPWLSWTSHEPSKPGRALSLLIERESVLLRSSVCVKPPT